MYSHTYGIDKDIFANLLWGNYFYDRNTRKFTKKAGPDYTKRTFVEFILEPIYKIFSHAVVK